MKFNSTTIMQKLGNNIHESCYTIKTDVHFSLMYRITHQKYNIFIMRYMILGFSSSLFKKH